MRFDTQRVVQYSRVIYASASSVAAASQPISLQTLSMRLEHLQDKTWTTANEPTNQNFVERADNDSSAQRESWNRLISDVQTTVQLLREQEDQGL